MGAMDKSHASSSRIAFLFLPLLLHIVTGSDYVPNDKILLSCGANSDVSDSDGRKWTTDVGSKFASSDGITSTAAAATQGPSVPSVPYMTSRIFKSDYDYSFPVAPGRKFIRLHFYPASYSGLSPTNAIFSVKSGPYILLNNFSASQTTEALNFALIVKEYSINVPTDSLTLTFSPSSSTPNSYAFVNGIEVISMPDIYSTADGSTTLIGLSGQFIINNSTALENLYRLNVGGRDISPSGDTGLDRSWYDDTPYIFSAADGVTTNNYGNMTITYLSGTPSYLAPIDVYGTARTMGPDPRVNLNYNLTWTFSVDSGFPYLVRLHFCELDPNKTKVNQRVFDIFIGNRTAQTAADVVAWTKKNAVATHQDYVLIVPSGPPQQDLWIAMHPNPSSKPQWYDAIMNGIEIFKVNDSSGSLAGLNPIPSTKQNKIDPKPVPRAAHTHKTAIIGGIVAAGVLAMVLVGLLGFARRRLKKGKYSSPGNAQSGWLPLSLYGHSVGSAKTNTTGSYASSLPSNICRHFSFAEIKSATNDFDEALILGVGGFGKVYKGEIDGGTTKVAIKRGNSSSDQGINEFQTEIEMLSKLRHRHLVSLIGYCEENCEMILVYDHMAYGTLREHLYNTEKPPMPWKRRLEICIGAARGLHYLHTGAKHTIIHRDVKTTNILLDEKWVAKVSDFGLSKTGPALDHTHVSTVVKGSFGYLDPEYFRRQQLTDKSDVYSFGVVLFEIICGRPALNPKLAKEEVSLAEWAQHCYKKGSMDQIYDPYLQGKMAPECIKKFVETAVKCINDDGIERPSMGDVLWNLEFALQLQESADELEIERKEDLIDLGGKKEEEESGFDSRSTTSVGISMSSIGGRSIASEDSGGITPSTVFSQIIDPKGR
ncbi:receptor-like protein kinase FERONIA [Impatiens glandulifera]|uniref:receptor-like protein kinase FERONIA n=1 Tax=Impatiens glandulifera TaxID=253017 RepID=UPI001FB0A7F1|nr:receptor-like protein kinase FERONIA [Impatiens glandulifera]